MGKLNLKMTLRECLLKFPQLEETLYKLLEECIYCEGFKDETLEEVFKAHRIEPEKGLEELERALEER
ncbi:hypothetical protein SAMN06269117_102121 [Balnearium lithotrophicum]|uniref:Hybrid cluster protein-associated redox disulfide domain-containing protein n=1 Tax=Balnearium lithotrophicum TaxID=223788 RepID=A0A521ATN0_9BACT|nr:hypothetical protein [Balnearium lithotrophicum]SMO38192.1 hypothetical protein SAMN06269117_102121 [Balnearium lithotrophicum]